MTNILNENYRNAKIFFDKAKKDYIYSGKKKFIDLSFASGTAILGHSSTIQTKIFKDFTKKNLSLFAPNKYTLDLLKTLKKFLPDHYTNIIFCNTGTEAVIKSLRISRAISDKKVIANVSGSWHGSVDQLLYMPKKNLLPRQISDGLNKDDKKNLIFIPYNNIIETKQILDKVKKKLACVIIEPIQGSLPNEISFNYLKFLHNYTKKNKIILVFDEMITGVRTGCKSVQEIYKLKPDISTFGKIFGGGMPIGFLALNNKISKKIKKRKLNIHFGGTFTSNPFTMYSSNETLKYIYKNKNKIFKKIEKYSKIFQESINDFCLKNELDIKVYRFQSMLRIIFTKDKINNRFQRDQLEKNKNLKIENFKNFLLQKKIYYPNNGIIFFSNQSSKENLNYLLKNFKIGLKKYFG